MSLYLTEVFPASTPSADRKWIRIVGPSFICCRTAMPMPTSAARIGTIQTAETR